MARTGPDLADTQLKEPLVHKKIRLTGQKPSFNDWEVYAVDSKRERLFLYGGVRPHDENFIPTCDFHCLDLRTMRWSNLTNSLKFRPRQQVFDPFLKDENIASQQLPALTDAACSIVSVGGGSYFFLFGGHNGVNATSDLIAIDLDLSVWWFVDIQGAPIRPRMSASMVSINNQLFIFGGRDQFTANAPAIHTYSIAEYSPQTRWTWRISDGPMPADVPSLGYSMQATPVYDGQKILLLQGRVNDQPINISRESAVLFHIQNHTFQDSRTTMGNFPRDMCWYRVASLDSGPQNFPPASPPTPRRRGRPPKNPPAAAPPAQQIHFSSSVVIFGWIKHTGDHLVAEAWHYMLPPAERIRCLDLKEQFWELDLDLQLFFAVGNRLFLLGSGGEKFPSEEGHEVPVWDFRLNLLLYKSCHDRVQGVLSLEFSYTGSEN
ncbi:hypothetical protein GGX14DRAFT_637403 [Mycena pura]|uniref:Kelch repeat protein n=1 Tax=Mycena pura TaxID=153505 RepID=A0AAD6V942_9AGAR|nr:hypothetical protein GGX14DRAFT_637403 [Mycena pura]